jgi:hypothetical protein
VLLEYRRRLRGTPGSAPPPEVLRHQAQPESQRGLAPERERERERVVQRGVARLREGERETRGRKGIYSLGVFRWADLGRRSACAELLYNINEIIQLNYMCYLTMSKN